MAACASPIWSDCAISMHSASAPLPNHKTTRPQNPQSAHLTPDWPYPLLGLAPISLNSANPQARNRLPFSCKAFQVAGFNPHLRKAQQPPAVRLLRCNQCHCINRHPLRVRTPIPLHLKNLFAIAAQAGKKQPGGLSGKAQNFKTA